MYSLKYFYVIGFIIVIMSFIVAVIYGRGYIENKVIERVIEENNASSVTVFNLSLWRKHHKLLLKLPCESSNCPDISVLKDDLKKFAGKFNLLSFNLYSAEGKNFFDKEQTLKYLYGSQADFIKEKISKGERAGLVLSDVKIGNDIFNIVRTFHPVKVGNTERVRAFAVIEYDITSFWGNPSLVQVLIVGSIIPLFISIFSFMYYATYRAEKLIAKQYEDNIHLIQEKASAEQASKEKSQFLANVSHELRTPLNAIIGFSEILKDEVMGPIENDQYKEYIRDINMSGVHLLSLINDILDYSKAEAGKLTVDTSEVDVTKILKNSLRLVSTKANDAGVVLENRVPKEHYILNIDGKRLKQVVLNLLSNSVKFTPEGKTVTLYAWNDIKDNNFVIEVQDAGLGIDEKDISKVMGTFGQVENKLSRKHEGTGLGLPLSKKLVELMGGKLQIESKLGEGTTVSVIFPCNEEGNLGNVGGKEVKVEKTVQEPAAIKPAVPQKAESDATTLSPLEVAKQEMEKDMMNSSMSDSKPKSQESSPPPLQESIVVDVVAPVDVSVKSVPVDNDASVSDIASVGDALHDPTIFKPASEQVKNNVDNNLEKKESASASKPPLDSSNT